MFVKVTHPGKVWTIHGCGEDDCFLLIEHYPRVPHATIDGVDNPPWAAPRSHAHVHEVQSKENSRQSRRDSLIKKINHFHHYLPITKKN